MPVLKTCHCYDPSTKRCEKVQEVQQILEYNKNYTYALTQTKTGAILFSTSNGIVSIDPLSFKTRFYRLKRHIRNTIIMAIEEDNDGNLWLATEGRGLIKIVFDQNMEITSIQRWYNIKQHYHTQYNANQGLCFTYR